MADRKGDGTIDKANPGIFDDEGRIIAKDWTRITIPENTVECFSSTPTRS